MFKFLEFCRVTDALADQEESDIYEHDGTLHVIVFVLQTKPLPSAIISIKLNFAEETVAEDTFSYDNMRKAESGNISFFYFYSFAFVVPAEFQLLTRLPFIL